jgi:glycosyltransferase involved in cell wall biosynthesis
MMSLHTSYSLAKPHKKEWNIRPLFEHFAVNPVIAAEGRLLRSVPTILANSSAIVADLAEASAVDFSDRTVIAPHGTTDPFAEKPQRRKLRSGREGRPVKLLYVGRFEARKGFDIAASAFANILGAGLDVEIDIVGDEITPAVEAWLSANRATSLLDNGRVKFHGLVDRERLDDLYADADAVLMPSRYESFGLVAIEAMAAGAPVIALEAGGIAEVVDDDVSGRLIPVDGRESQSITKVLTALVRDADLRRRLSDGARKAFEAQFTLERMIDGVEVALDQAMQRKGVANGT